MDSTFKKNLSWDYLNRFGNIFFSLITSTILARLLSPDDYGLVGISMAVNGIAGIFLNLGFVSAIIQAKEIDNKSLSTVFFLNICIAFIIYGSIFFSSVWVSNFYHLPALANILKVTALAFLFNAMSIVPNALMTRAMKFKQMAFINLASAVLSGILGIVMAANHFGVWSLVAQQMCTAVFGLFGLFIATKWLPVLYFRLASIKSMFRFGMYLFFSGLLEGAYSRIDVFLIAKVFSPATLGLYTRAQGLDGMIRNLSSGSLLNVLFPTFTKIQADIAQLKKLYYQYFELISFLFCLLAGIFYISADQIFLLLFGPQWVISAGYFKILVLAGFAYPLSSLSLSVVEARGNSKNFFKVEVIKKVLQLPCYFIAYFYGIIPFLCSYVVFAFLATFINVRFVKFELEISILSTIKYLSRYFFVCLAIVAIIEFVNGKIETGIPLLTCIIEALSFIALYLGIHYSFKSKGMQYAFALIKKQHD